MEVVLGIILIAVFFVMFFTIDLIRYSKQLNKIFEPEIKNIDFYYKHQDMIPDKIYIRTGMSGLLYGSKVKSFETDAEYIRKDALIKWANSWLAFKRSGIVLDDGFSYAMEELIKKLNEM